VFLEFAVGLSKFFVLTYLSSGWVKGKRPPADFVVTSDPHCFFWGDIHTCVRSPESPHRARHEFALGCGVPLCLHLQILFFLLWAALVLKMAGLSKFLANGVALIAQVGSENQAQPTRVLGSVFAI
jgi:hypothetical protein